MNAAAPSSSQDPEKAERTRKLLAEAEAWTAAQGAPPKSTGELLSGGIDEFRRMAEQWPAPVEEIPFHLTPEGGRLAEFKKVIDAQFDIDVDPAKIRNRATFEKATSWSGVFPGVVLTGTSGHGKTFIAWQLLRRLYVKESKTFTWFSAKRLMSEMERYDKNECLPDFFRMNDYVRLWFIDDLDKINWDYESNATNLFHAIDWIYRKKKPCIITTNRDRAWWKSKMGDAFVRRLFDDGLKEVEFK